MIVDAHVHIWDVDGGTRGIDYPWLRPDLHPLYRSYSLDDIDPELHEYRVDGLVLVQASDSRAETQTLLAAAARASRRTAVVGWLPLDDPAAIAAQLAGPRPAFFVGVRHMIHLDPDPRWLTRAAVGHSMDLLAAAGLTFDAVAERPDLLALIPGLAYRHPALTIVLDHLGKPPIADGEFAPWAGQITEIAAHPNVVTKLSGLATVSGGDVSAARWQPYVDHVLEVFGPRRLMFGSDWPFTLTAADYHQVWDASIGTLTKLSTDDRAQVLGATATRVYRLAEMPEMSPATTHPESDPPCD